MHLQRSYSLIHLWVLTNFHFSCQDVSSFLQGTGFERHLAEQ